MIHSYPILSLEDARELEKSLLSGKAEKVAKAIQSAGKALGNAILKDIEGFQKIPQAPCILVLCGKGHNTADALMATCRMLHHLPRSHVTLAWVLGPDQLKPATQQALKTLRELTPCTEITAVTPSTLQLALEHMPKKQADWTLDAIFGLGGHVSMRAEVTDVIHEININSKFGLKIAIDLPSGFETKTSLKAHLTYLVATPKSQALDPEKAACLGLVRFLDIGFFKKPARYDAISHRLVTHTTLKALNTPRKVDTNKYEQGVVAIIAGSGGYPGSILLAAQGALEAGAGLVYAFAPKNLVPTFAAECPEVIWRSQAAKAEDMLVALQSIKELGCVVIGPGLGQSPKVKALVRHLSQNLATPIVFDADALISSLPEVLLQRKALQYISILTPHVGEWARLSSESNASKVDDLQAFAKIHNCILHLKGYLSCTTDGERTYSQTAGNPILARGGTGDILAGMIGTIVAQGQTPLEATTLAALWHGTAADQWATLMGPRATRTSDFFSFLSKIDA